MSPMGRRLLSLATALVSSASPALAQGVTTGALLFETTCAACHASPADDRTPDRDALRQRTPEAVLDAITSGPMAIQAESLSDGQKRALAEYLTGRPLGAAKSGHASAMPNRCRPTALGNPLEGPRWNGWGVDATNGRYQTAEAAGLTAADLPRLKLKWAFGFPNGSSAYGQPTVAGGRVFVGADTGFVYSLDAATGCVHWSFEAQAGVRTAISIGSIAAGQRPFDGARGRFAAYFGDVKANVYAVDAETGTLIWTRRADTHPIARITGAPTLSGGRLYVPVSSLEEAAGANPNYECCTFRGSIVAYDATTGDQIWKSYTIPDAPRPVKRNAEGTQLWAPAGAAIWASPTVDTNRGALYVATGNGYTAPAAATSDAVVAFDLATGTLLWWRQVTPNDAFVIGCGQNNRTENCPDEVGPDFDFGNSPILRSLPDGRDIIVIGQKSGVAWGLDPDRKGAVVWQHRVGKGTALGGMEWGSAADLELGYFPVADARFGPSEAGGMAAVRLATGERVWYVRPPALECAARDRNCMPAQSAAISVIPGAVFSGTTDGMMRAFSTKTGGILWEFNSVLEYSAVNGVETRGGTFNGPGPTMAGGMLFMTSGYAHLGGGIPGNALLAFGVD